MVHSINQSILNKYLNSISYFLCQKLSITSSTIWLSLDLVALTYGLRLSRKDYEDFILRLKHNLIDANPDFTFLISTFNFEFPQIRLYDIRKTIGQSGAFGNYLLKHFPCSRTKDCFYSFLVFGKNSSIFLSREYYSSVGEGSIFDQLIKNKAVAITIGHHWSSMSSFVHHSEYLAGISYRYNKKFEGELIDCYGVRKNHTQTFYARKLDMCDYSAVTTEGNNFLLNQGAISLDAIELSNSYNVLVYTGKIDWINDLVVSSFSSSDSAIVESIPAGGGNSRVITSSVARSLYLMDLKGMP